MKKKNIKILAVLMSMALLGMTGCGQDTGAAAESVPAETERAGETESLQLPAETQQEEETKEVRIGALKGPTAMGLVHLMHQAGKSETLNQYSFTLETAADTLLAKMIKGELDIALLPANIAGILYQKSEGAVSVIDINTLGVLYIVSADDSVSSIKDLKGKTLYLTGKGTTPDYVLQYLLKQNGMSAADVKLEYKSEAAEVAALLADNAQSFGLLPQPFATAACLQNSDLKEVIDITQQWDETVKDNSRLVTGVTVVRREFLQMHPQAVADFLTEHQESVEYANTETEAAAELIVDFGIIEKSQIALQAMPKCNLVFLEGEEMQQALSGYLQVLYDQNPESVGGSMPGTDFYWLGNNKTE